MTRPSPVLAIRVPSFAGRLMGFPQRSTTLAAAMVLTLGVTAVAADCLDVSQPSVFNLHLLFGIALWLVAGTCLLRQRRGAQFVSAACYHEYARRLSRWVYILLYLLAGVRLAFHLSEVMSLSSAVHRGAAAHAPRSLDDFQVYIAYAVLPLWAMRLLMLYVPTRASAN